MRIVSGWFFSLLTAALMAAPMEGHWRSMARPSDVQLIEAIDEKVQHTLAFYEDKTLTQADLSVYDGAIKFANVTSQPINTKALLGQWSCRSYQISERIMVRYAFFNCRVNKTAKGLWFEKTSGSQRVSGYLYPDDGSQMVFIGGATVNNDPLQAYDLGQPDTANQYENHNAVGVMRQLSPRKMIMIQPSRHHAGYELYELVKKQ